PCQVGAQLVERHHAGVSDPLTHAPFDPLVRSLGLDLGRELLRLAPDLGRKGHRAVVFLGYTGHAMHEARPILKLRPLVVDGLERGADVDALLHRHAPVAPDAEAATPTSATPAPKR